MCDIVNNSAADRPISLKFYTEFVHDARISTKVEGQVKGSKVKVIACHDVLASKNRYISWMDSLTEFKFRANYPRA